MKAKRIIGLLLAFTMIWGIYPITFAAETDYTDYVKSDTIPGHIFRNMDVTYFNVSYNGSNTTPYTSYLYVDALKTHVIQVTYAEGKNLSSAIPVYGGAVNLYVPSSTTNPGTMLEEGKNYVVMVDVQNAAPEVNVEPIFAVDLYPSTGYMKGTHDYAYTTVTATGDEWETFKTTLTAGTSGTSASYVCYGILNPTAGGWYSDNGLESPPVGTKVNFKATTAYIAEEIAFDISVTNLTETEISAGDTIELQAEVLNQIEEKGKLSQNFTWLALNKDRTEIDTDITIEAGGDGTAIVNVPVTKTPGDYVILAKSEDYDGFQKGIDIKVKKPVIKDTPDGTDPIHHIKLDVTDGKTTMGVFGSLTLKASLVDSINEIGTNVQSFDWYVLNEERTDKITDNIIITTSDDTTEAVLTFDTAIEEGNYYIVAESTAEESLAMRKSIGFTIDKSGDIENIAESFASFEEENIANKLPQYAEILEITSDIVTNADATETSKLIKANVSEQSLEDKDSIAEYIVRMAAMSLYNTNPNNVSLYNEAGEFSIAELKLEDKITSDILNIYKELMSNNGRLNMQSLLTKGGHSSYSKFVDTVQEAIILHAIAYPNVLGVGYLESIMTEDNLKEIGIEDSVAAIYGKLSDDVGKPAFNESVARKLITKNQLVLELKDALEKDEEDKEDEKGGSTSTRGNRKDYGSSVTIKKELKEATPVVKTFDDVPEGHWAHADIYFLKELGVIDGVTANRFAPDNNVTREQFLKLVLEAFKINSGTTDIVFSDAVKDAWYEDYLKIGVSNGIITGNGDGTFGVGKNVTRQDACVIMARAMGINVEMYEQADFLDADTIDNYAINAVSSLVEYTIINGFPDKTFGPRLGCTRAEAATMIAKAITILNSMKVSEE